MIRNWYNQIPHPALRTKREINKYINWQQFTKGRRGKPNEQLFPRQVVIQLPKICHWHNRWTKLQTRTARTSNSKEPQHKYRLGTVSVKMLEAYTFIQSTKCGQPYRLLDTWRRWILITSLRPRHLTTINCHDYCIKTERGSAVAQW